MRTWPSALLALTLAAGGDPPTESDALYHQAEAEDAAGDYAAALSDYRRLVDTAPSARWAAKASSRADVLAAHAEGDFAPFARLEAARRDARFADDPAAIEALARAADAFPDGPTRAEARLVCAEAWLRAGKRDAGEEALRRAIDDPRAEPLLRKQAARALVTAIEDDGATARAAEVARALGDAVDAKTRAHAEQLARRTRVHGVALGDVIAVAALAALGIARGHARAAARAARKIAPWVLGLAAYVALAGGALAAAYESGTAAPFMAFGATLVPVVVLARAWGAAGSEAPTARAARAAACASMVVAAAFLVLEAVDAAYLESFGL